MKIIFYEHRYGGFIDKLIRFKTATWKQRFNGKWKDLPSHCELLFSDDMMFSASAYEDITRFKKHSMTGHDWCRIDLGIDKDTEAKIRLWCENKVGKKYDYLGILGFILPFVKQSKKRWFCSEICCEALKENTDLIPSVIISSKTSPIKLKEIIKVK